MLVSGRVIYIENIYRCIWSRIALSNTIYTWRNTLFHWQQTLKKYKIISFCRFLWFQHNSKNWSSKLEDLTVMLQMMNMGMGYFRGEGSPFLYKKNTSQFTTPRRAAGWEANPRVDWHFFFREMTVRMFRVDAGILARFYAENVKIRKKLR